MTTNKMAEGSAAMESPAAATTRSIEESSENYEPEMKKSKVEVSKVQQPYKLEERLNGILCCAVCLDLPEIAVFQCNNGHLMCASCLSHLLADARLKDESATCPNCRGEISKTLCTRNLAVEKAISELPSACHYCSQLYPRSLLDSHERNACVERPVQCRYARIGCPWNGPFHEAEGHEVVCTHPSRPAGDIISLLDATEQRHKEEILLYKNIFGLLSLEKITFSDVQLRPYRTDEFISKLFYETSRFSAFNLQWVVKARVNDDAKHPAYSCQRPLAYQLVLKSKLAAAPGGGGGGGSGGSSGGGGSSAAGSMTLQYVAISGPYAPLPILPAVYRYDFSNEAPETVYNELPLRSSADCNRLLAARTISLRLILFQMQK